MRRAFSKRSAFAAAAFAAGAFAAVISCRTKTLVVTGRHVERVVAGVLDATEVIGAQVAVVAIDRQVNALTDTKGIDASVVRAGIIVVAVDRRVDALAGHALIEV